MENGTQRRLDELKAHLREVDDLRSVGSLLAWDQATYMPEAGAPARAGHLGGLVEPAAMGQRGGAARRLST